jgi:V8-like Glu-specific endopeptidase
MRRTLIALGIGLGLLGSTAVSAPAQAEDVATSPLVSSVTAAQQAAWFWLADGAANLKNATPYAVQTEVHGERVSTSIVPDGKPGSTAPTPGPTEPKGKTPTTSGKVFFVAADGQPHWCTGTALQSQYRNLVATAGHCVYDTQRNDATLDKWVFVPGYADGATPWGLYVGKQAFTHDDFSTYHDYNRDFAFVNVYSGVVPSSSPDALTNTGRLADNVGGQGFAWNQTTTSSIDIFGYPAGPNPDGRYPYTGQNLEWTSAMQLSDLATSGQFIGAESPFTGEGSLGSSWLYRYSNDYRAGYLNGITISVADTDSDNRYDTSVSPYFDGQVNTIYRAAATLWTGSIA